MFFLRLGKSNTWRWASTVTGTKNKEGKPHRMYQFYILGMNVNLNQELKYYIKSASRFTLSSTFASNSFESHESDKNH